MCIRDRDGVAYKKGINVYAPMYINKRLKLYSGTNLLSEIDGAISWNKMCIRDSYCTYTLEFKCKGNRRVLI